MVTYVHVIHMIIYKVPQLILRTPSLKPKVLNNIIVPTTIKKARKSWVIRLLGYIGWAIYIRQGYVYLRESAYICVGRYTQNIFTI